MAVLDDLLEKIDQQEFEQLSAEVRAVIPQHQHWLNKLNIALLTNTPVSSEDAWCCCSHSHCQFGQWIEQVLKKNVFQHSFFYHLDDLHREFHGLANQLIINLNEQKPFDLAVYEQLLDIQHSFSAQLLHLFEFSAVSKHQFDTTTGLMNRRSVDSVLAYEKYRLHRNHQFRCFIALLDIDHFKLINDQYGHDIGDQVLNQIATVLQSMTRQSDVIARYGGEEFLFVLPEMKLEEALEGIERVRRRLAETPLRINDLRINVTASFGVTELCRHCDVEKSLKRADVALYLAKQEGRNRTAYIDINEFDEQERQIGIGPINDEFVYLMSQYSRLVNA
ncbi:MAG: diguanylate cyclase [Amphritea sp.]|nr:diguanylate cyclase [Amphritea sp.]